MTVTIQKAEQFCLWFQNNMVQILLCYVTIIWRTVCSSLSAVSPLLSSPLVIYQWGQSSKVARWSFAERIPLLILCRKEINWEKFVNKTKENYKCNFSGNITIKKQQNLSIFSSFDTNDRIFLTLYHCKTQTMK